MDTHPKKKKKGIGLKFIVSIPLPSTSLLSDRQDNLPRVAHVRGCGSGLGHATASKRLDYRKSRCRWGLGQGRTAFKSSLVLLRKAGPRTGWLPPDGPWTEGSLGTGEDWRTTEPLKRGLVPQDPSGARSYHPGLPCRPTSGSLPVRTGSGRGPGRVSRKTTPVPRRTVCDLHRSAGVRGRESLRPR